MKGSCIIHDLPHPCSPHLNSEGVHEEDVNQFFVERSFPLTDG
jgi:hypothetical protein